MVVELARVEQPERLDVQRVCRLVDETERATDKVLALPVEIDGHGAQESELQVAVTVEAVTVGDADPEVAINAHVLNLCDELLPVALDDVVEGDDVARDHLEVCLRHNFTIFNLIDRLLRLLEHTAGRSRLDLDGRAGIRVTFNLLELCAASGKETLRRGLVG